jgi:hypothetical protein
VSVGVLCVALWWCVSKCKPTLFILLRELRLFCCGRGDLLVVGESVYLYLFKGCLYLV